MNLDGSTAGFTFGTVFVIISICFACIRLRRLSNNPVNTFGTAELSSGAEYGLHDSIINSFPKLSYSEMRKSSYNNNPNNIEDPSSSSSCSICLADYKEEDMLRLLPRCGHLYHLHCVDPWLKLHNTCPICRIPPTSSCVGDHDDRSNDSI
ncbi:putative RING-H2 finger protein ATL71 [Neltuma alba]|uniref:putative RING-H2 finger protein ATL71 n=1 Tax=Neltuma alba TaxID=207710 RepID=UPI0010A40817|nr:putative RING-H2 finger protein ATL71 [Prosopis alba]XP_028806244.1 putative RING-H2 finger protein ATL71 [Prosopis alba]